MQLSSGRSSPTHKQSRQDGAFHGKGRGMDLLVGHIQERKGPMGQGSKIDYRKVSLKNRIGILEIKPYMYGRVLST